MPDSAATAGDGSLPVVSIPAGEFVFRAGDAADCFFIVSSGQIELVSGGREPRRLALLAERDLCGEDSAFEKKTRACDARAVTAATLIRVTVASFLDLLRVRPELASAVIGWSAGHLHRGRVARTTMAQPPAGVRGASPVRFVHVESGVQFPLPDSDEAVVGRADPSTKFQPAIELSGVDAHRSLSRRHATIKRTGTAYEVVERGHVANGTFVNGKRLSEGVAIPIKDGDEVTFGLITTVFRTT